MPAFCALCTRELTKGEPFVLSGFEVFHTKCVKERGTTESIVARLRRELAETRREATSSINSATQTILEAEAEIRRLRSELKGHLDLETEYRRQRNEARAERDTMSGSVTAANARADNYARELALMRTLAAPSPTQVAPIAPAAPAPAAPQASATPADDRDATEIRFSLLELDPS